MKFYEILEEIGGNRISDHWTKNPTGEDGRGYTGIKFKPTVGFFL